MNDNPSAPLPPALPLEPLPESYGIPAVLVEDWLAIPPNARVSIELRRDDLDNFHASINRCIEAQYAFQNCMIEFTGGHVDAANVNLRMAQRKLIEAQNSLRQLMTSIMASATRGVRA